MYRKSQANPSQCLFPVVQKHRSIFDLERETQIDEKTARALELSLNVRCCKLLASKSIQTAVQLYSDIDFTCNKSTLYKSDHYYRILPK